MKAFCLPWFIGLVKYQLIIHPGQLSEACLLGLVPLGIKGQFSLFHRQQALAAYAPFFYCLQAATRLSDIITTYCSVLV